MKSEYERIFEQRGISYDTAMRRYPHARDEEFRALFSEVDFSGVRKVADIPSGGGYLTRFLPLNCDIDYFEPCDAFQPHHGTRLIDLERIPLPSNEYDIAVNLAAIHHIDDKQHFISSLFDSLKPNGYLCIGDVMAESNIAHFLDNFAGKHNGTGHNGRFLTLRSISDITLPSDYHLIENKIKPCDWIFDDEVALLDFCRLLFGLYNISDETLLTALSDIVGISYQDNKVRLLWHLLYITIRKA
jgi:SAM-dependent methyltransferase